MNDHCFRSSLGDQGGNFEVFGSVKTTLIKEFDMRYPAIVQAAIITTTTTVAITGLQRGGAMQYQDFSNMQPSEFKGDKDPIIAIRLISDVKGCFYTCSCPKDQKVKFVMNLR